MIRLMLSVAAGLVLAAGANAHFIFLIPAQDGNGVKIVLSDGLDVDDHVDAKKFASTRLKVRLGDGKEQEVACKAHEHHLEAALPGSGPRLAFATTDYGVLQRGDAKPFLLLYHSKLILGDLTKVNSRIGTAAPVELVPEIADGKIRFQVLVKGTAKGGVEVNLLLPEEKKEKLTTNDEGYTKWFAAPGRYGAWVRSTESASGEVGGKKYEEIRHYATVVVDLGGK